MVIAHDQEQEMRTEAFLLTCRQKVGTDKAPPRAREMSTFVLSLVSLCGVGFPTDCIVS